MRSEVAVPGLICCPAGCGASSACLPSLRCTTGLGRACVGAQRLRSQAPRIQRSAGLELRPAPAARACFGSQLPSGLPGPVPTARHSMGARVQGQSLDEAGELGRAPTPGQPARPAVTRSPSGGTLALAVCGAVSGPCPHLPVPPPTSHPSYLVAPAEHPQVGTGWTCPRGHRLVGHCLVVPCLGPIASFQLSFYPLI